MSRRARPGSCHMPVFCSLTPIVKACAVAPADSAAARARVSVRRIRDGVIACLRHRSDRRLEHGRSRRSLVGGMLTSLLTGRQQLLDAAYEHAAAIPGSSAGVRYVGWCWAATMRRNPTRSAQGGVNGYGTTCATSEGMVDQIERLPASPDRDRLLSEIRLARWTSNGVTPRAVLSPCESPRRRRCSPPRDGAKCPGSAGRVAAGRRLLRSRGAPARPPALRRTRSRRSGLVTACRSRTRCSSRRCRHVRARNNRAVPPWTFGLRG